MMLWALNYLIGKLLGILDESRSSIIIEFVLVFHVFCTLAFMC